MSTLIRGLVAGAAVILPLVLVYAGLLPRHGSVLSVLAIVVLLFWRFRERVHAVLLVFLVVFLLSTVAARPWPRLTGAASHAGGVEALRQQWTSKGPFNDQLPVVVHLVFDEMMSAGAIDPSTPAGSQMRDALHAMGRRHGLRMFDAVYSRHYFSGVSLPHLFDEEYLGRTRYASHFSPLETVPENAYLEDVAARGYRIAVFQTSVLDFCASDRIALCETFPSFDPGGAGGGLDARSRRLALWSTLLRAYAPSYTEDAGLELLRWAYGLEDRPIGILGVEGRFDAQRFPSWFDRFRQFVMTVPRGSHVFAHFMVPHGPYLLTPDCIVSGRVDVGYYLARRFPNVEQREQERQRYTEDYLGQLSCVQRTLDRFLADVAHTPHLRDATILIHGDHGSRISSGNLIEDYTRDDFVANYATFFAVKSPRMEPGIDCEFLSLPEAFRRGVAGILTPQALDRALPPVMVNSRAQEGRLVEAPMPPFGCAARPQ